MLCNASWTESEFQISNDCKGEKHLLESTAAPTNNILVTYGAL